MSWFKDWFDSHLYELLYSYRNEAEANKLAGLIEKKIPKQTYPKLVDVGCGRGRHSISLAERGYRVTGFDLSPQAIEKARNIARRRGLEQVQFLVNDMREPLDETFDAALNLFTTFGYFYEDDENVKVLKSIRQMLREDGLFLIDFMNANKVARELVPEEAGSHKGIVYKINRFIEDGFVYKKIKFEGDKSEHQQKYTERVKLFDREWFTGNLKKCGFTPLHVWGDYSGGEFNEDESPRLIILSKSSNSDLK